MKKVFILSFLVLVACNDKKAQITVRMNEIKNELPKVQKSMDSAIKASKGDSSIETYKRNEAINYKLFHLKNEYDSLELELRVLK